MKLPTAQNIKYHTQMNINNIQQSGIVFEVGELKTTSTGTQALSVRVGCRLTRAKNPVYYYVNAKFYGKTAEYAAKIVKKGDNIIFSGVFCPEEYTDKRGQKRMSLDVFVNQYKTFPSNYSKGEPNQNSAPSPKQELPSAPQQQDEPEMKDIPF